MLKLIFNIISVFCKKFEIFRPVLILLENSISEVNNRTIAEIWLQIFLRVETYSPHFGTHLKFFLYPDLVQKEHLSRKLEHLRNLASNFLLRIGIHILHYFNHFEHILDISDSSYQKIEVRFLFIFSAELLCSGQIRHVQAIKKWQMRSIISTINSNSYKTFAARFMKFSCGSSKMLFLDQIRKD